MPRDPKDTCEHCPAWAKAVDYDGREILVPMLGADGQPVTKDGAVQHEKAVDGRFVMSGNCRLRAPLLVNNGAATSYPAAKSNWWCEDPDRHAMMERLAR